MHRKSFSLVLVAFFFFATGALFESFNYLEPATFKSWLESKRPVIIADIQVEKEFAAHHFPGSFETNAYPVKSEVERQRLEPVVQAFQERHVEVVVVCPRGGGGAKRAYSYLKSRGIPEEKLFILTGGMEKWPYRGMLEGVQ